ncbi:M48 family metallopeptidase [Vibrio sp.]|nr:M48 family metallopeptidase [Vibrio sp.]
MTSLILPYSSTLTATEELPDIGTAASSTLTINQELHYGDAYMRMIRSSYPIINDPVLDEYITTLGHRLVANANDVKTPFTFFVIRDSNINAFAFFGGYIAIHSGLLTHTQSESELASVLAHEVAHVTQRHLARAMEEQARTSPATLAALAGSLLLAVAAPPAGIAALATTQASIMQGQINYTRSNEKEADRFGLQTLSYAGFDPHAMPTFFGRLSEKYRYASKPPPMLLTHPLPEDRLTDSRQRAQQFKSRPVQQSLNFHLARTRVIARYTGSKDENTHDWMLRQRKRAPAHIKEAFDYGIALTYLDNHELKKAESALRPLYNSKPNNHFYLDAMTDLLIAQNKESEAIKLLDKALKVTPNNPVLQLNKANVYIQANQYDNAFKILQRYTYEHPNDTNGWSLLSEASARLGNNAEEVAARAEIHSLKAEWDKAIQYYSQASQLAELGSLEQARYDARIDELIIQRERFLALQ